VKIQRNTNPQSIDVAVVDDILSLFLVRCLVDITEDVRQEAVRPVPGVGIEDSVQFHDAPLLGVDGVQLGGDAHLGLGRRQGVEDHGLAAASGADYHGSMAGHHCLIKLDYFVYLDWQ